MDPNGRYEAGNIVIIVECGMLHNMPHFLSVDKMCIKNKENVKKYLFCRENCFFTRFMV